MLLTVKQAAEQLRLSESEVYELCRTGMLRHMRIGVRKGRIRIKAEDLSAYLESCEVAPVISVVDGRERRTSAALSGAGFSRLRAGGYKPKQRLA